MGKRPAADMQEHADDELPSKTDILLERIVTLLDAQSKTPELQPSEDLSDIQFPAFTLAENPYFSCIEANPQAAKAFHLSMSQKLIQGQTLTTREAIDFAVLSVYTAQHKANALSEEHQNGFLMAMNLYGIITPSLIGNKQINQTLTENKDSLEAWQTARKAAIQASANYVRPNYNSFGSSQSQKRSTINIKSPSPKKKQHFKKPPSES